MRSYLDLRSCLPHIHQREQLRCALFPPCVSTPFRQTFRSELGPREFLNVELQL